MQIRKNAESITFYALQDVGIENIEIDPRLQTIIKNMHEINVVQQLFLPLGMDVWFDCFQL